MTIAENSQLKEIGKEAFYCTGITSLVLPDSVEVIGNEAFRECKLETVTIGTESALKSIGYRGFYNAGSFETIYLPASLETMGSEAFAGCYLYKNGSYVKGLKTVRIADGCKLKAIPYECFRNDYFLQSINIPNGIETIGEEAFSECKKLDTMILPSSIRTIGKQAFWLCYDEKTKTGLSKVIMEVGPEDGLTIGEEAFDLCENLSICEPISYAISFGEEAFWKTALKEVHIRNGVTVIPEDCFNLNESLETLTLPEGLLEIAEDAFSNCTSLTSVALPDSLTTIGNTAFYACDSLTSFHIPANVSHIEPGRGPVGSCAELKTITVDPANPYYDSRENCNCIIRTQDNAVICVCQNSVIPASVEIIEQYTFSGTKGLKKLVFGSGTSKLKEVRHAAFAWNDDIEEAVFPDGVIFTGSMHFQQCGSLQKVSLPWGITEIPSSAFFKCGNLKDLVLPSSFTSMTWNPLSNTGLSEITFEGNTEIWSSVEIDDRSSYWKDHVSFTAGTIPVSEADIQLSAASAVYTGKPIEMPLTAAYRGIPMKLNRDFRVSYKNNKEIGTAKVIITGIGSFKGDRERSFTITAKALPKSIAGATVTGIIGKTYTGKPVTQNPKVVLNGVVLKKDIDYKLAYKNNINAGKATVTITGIGDYSGSIPPKTFTIAKRTNPMDAKGRTVSVKSAKVKKKAQTIKRSKAITFKKDPKGKVTYTKTKGTGKIKVNKKTGNITINEGLKKGTYTVKIKITAAETANYKKGMKNVSVKVKVN